VRQSYTGGAPVPLRTFDDPGWAELGAGRGVASGVDREPGNSRVVKVLNSVVRRIAAMPGQRALVLISRGS